MVSIIIKKLGFVDFMTDAVGFYVESLYNRKYVVCSSGNNLGTSTRYLSTILVPEYTVQVSTNYTVLYCTY
jgi:hypothetical protein